MTFYHKQWWHSCSYWKPAPVYHHKTWGHSDKWGHWGQWGHWGKWGCWGNKAKVDAVDDIAYVSSNAYRVINVLDNDKNPHHKALTITKINGMAFDHEGKVTLASGAVVWRNHDGTLTYDTTGADKFDKLPLMNVADDGFEYTVSDGYTEDKAHVDVKVYGDYVPNKAPVAVDDTVDAGSNAVTVIDVLGNDSDADGDTLTVTKINGIAFDHEGKVTLDSGAVVKLNHDGTLTYDLTGVDNFDNLPIGKESPDTFVYTVSDGEAEDTGTVSVAVQGDVDPNNAPVAVDDTADAGSNMVTVINVLGNDSDPDGDKLSVTKINGVAFDNNGEVTLASGAVVKLNADGTLSYDLTGADNYDDLLIRKDAPDSFEYTLSDGDLEDTGKVDVTVHGNKNTIDTIKDGLPDTIEMVLNNAPNTSFAVTLSSSDARFDAVTVENAYCLSIKDSFLLGTKLTGSVFLADAASVPAGAIDQPGGPTGSGTSARDNLDLINWILNQGFENQSSDSLGGPNEGRNYNEDEIQAAIWGLTDNDIYVGNTPPGNGNVANAVEIAMAALQHGEGYKPGEGDIIGLFFEPDAATEAKGHHQPFIMGISYDDLQEAYVPPVHDTII